MSRALGFVLVTLVACGGARPTRVAPRRAPTASVSVSASPSAAPAPSPMDRLDAIARREAPGTREILRRDASCAGSAAIDLAAQDHDSCLRVFVVADFPVKATVESKGRELAAGEAAEAAALVLAPRGPVCVRRGEAPVVRLEGTGTAHVIVRASP